MQQDDTSILTSLTTRQQKLIPYLLSCASVQEACRKGKVSKPTIYGWLKQDAFRDELQKQGDFLYSTAIDGLKGGTTKAVEKLLKLLNSRNETIAFRAAQAIISLAIRTKESHADSKRAEDKGSPSVISLENVLAIWEEDDRANAEKRRAVNQGLS